MRRAARIAGKRIEAVKRYGKFIVVSLRGGGYLTIHLGMTGSLRVRVIGTVTRNRRPRRRGRTGGWQNATVSLSRFAGQTVRIEISRRDAAVTGLRINRY